MNLLITIIDYAYAALLKIKSFFINEIELDNSKKLRSAIIIPGVYETPIYFKSISSTLAENYNIIHSDSIYGKGGSIDENARSIAKYIDKSKLSDVLVVGHSSGGLVAVKALGITTKISSVITIATPFHGVQNGHLLRTKLVRELLPTSDIVKSMANLPHSSLRKITSMYPSFDNQVWSKEGSILRGAKNIKVNAKGHHRILRRSALQKAILAAI